MFKGVLKIENLKVVCSNFRHNSGGGAGGRGSRLSVENWGSPIMGFISFLLLNVSKICLREWGDLPLFPLYASVHQTSAPSLTSSSWSLLTDLVCSYNSFQQDEGSFDPAFWIGVIPFLSGTLRSAPFLIMWLRHSA